VDNVVFKHGFKIDVPEDEAIRTAVEAARADAASQGKVLDDASIVTRVFSSPAHQEVDEYLVRVDALARPA